MVCVYCYNVTIFQYGSALFENLCRVSNAIIRDRLAYHDPMMGGRFCLIETDYLAGECLLMFLL